MTARMILTEERTELQAPAGLKESVTRARLGVLFFFLFFPISYSSFCNIMPHFFTQGLQHSSIH